MATVLKVCLTIVLSILLATVYRTTVGYPVWRVVKIRPPPPVFRFEFTTDPLVWPIRLSVRPPIAVPQFSWTLLIVSEIKFVVTRTIVIGMGTKSRTVLTTALLHAIDIRRF